MKEPSFEYCDQETREQLVGDKGSNPGAIMQGESQEASQ